MSDSSDKSDEGAGIRCKECGVLLPAPISPKSLTQKELSGFKGL